MKGPVDEEAGILLKALMAHFNMLVAARSDSALLRQYSALLRFLKSKKGKSLQDSFQTESHIEPLKPSLTFNDEQLSKASLDELEKLINDDLTARKDLEHIAIYRFSVPRGSMRSFSNKQMLIDKLRTLISNERTHETIGTVARGEVK